MKIAICADVHLGNHKLFGGPLVGSVNKRALQGLHALRSAYLAADYDDADEVVIAGDLLDVDVPPPALLAATKEVISASVGTIVLNGNHEMTSTNWQDTAISPLASDSVTVAQRDYAVSYEDACVLLVPHRPGPAKEWLRGAVEQAASSCATVTKSDNGLLVRSTGTGPVVVPLLLVVHLGLEDEETAPWLRGADDSIHVDQLANICVEFGIKHVVAGNWHAAKTYERRGVLMRQVGALVPTGFDNLGIEPYGRLVWWESDGKQAKFTSDSIIKGPRFVKFTKLRDMRKFFAKADKLDENLVYIHAQLKAAEWLGGQALLERQKEAHLIVDYKMSRDPKEVRKRTAKAAQAAQRADTLDQALAQYVEEFPLPPGVEVSPVRNKCRELLKLGGTDGAV